MFYFIYLLLAGDSIDVSQWTAPVIYGSKPLMRTHRLYFPDRAEKKVKVYDIGNGLTDPELLWTTPGKGQGPGEIGQGEIHGLAFDDAEKHLWVSHYGGFQVFTDTGEHLKDFKVNSNFAHLLVLADTIVLGPRSAIVHHKQAFRFFAKNSFGAGKPKRFIENPRGIPVLNNGDFLSTQPELFALGDTLISYDFATAELMACNADGDKLTTLRNIPYVPHPDAEISGYKHWTRSITEISQAGFFNAVSGIASAGKDRLWLTLQSYSHKIEDFRRYLVLYSLEEDKVLARYPIPGFTGAFCIVGKRHGKLLLLELEEGRELVFFEPRF
ncbi:MAG: hypothetical protein QNK37_15515 [Acidobacteriota bacterium]|nr:hypothetical protein [Acidobacteriota bacterium]